MLLLLALGCVDDRDPNDEKPPSEDTGAPDDTDSGDTDTGATDTGSTDTGSAAFDCSAAGPVHVGDVAIEDDDPSWFCDSYGSIEGDLLVGRRTLPDLAGLECLCEVTGRVSIWNTNMTSLAGLDGLQRARILDISNDDELVSLAGLEALRSVDRIDFWALPALADVSALGGVSGSLEQVQIFYADALPDLVGFDGIDTIDELYISDSAIPSVGGLGGLRVARELTLANLPALQGVDGLRALVEVDELVFSDLPVLGTLDGLGALTTVGSLGLYDLDVVESLAPLSALVDVTHVALQGNDRLVDIGALSALGADAGEVSVTDNVALADLSVFAGLRTVESLAVGGNAASSYAAFSGLTSVARNLYLGEVGAPDLAPFAGIASVERLTLTGLTVTDLAGLENLAAGDTLDVLDCDALVDLDVLSDVPFTSVTVRDCDRLVDLSGLEGMRGYWLGSYVQVKDNAALTTLAGLDGLTEIATLTIDGNGVLADLSALDGLVTVTDVASITNNPALPTSDADDLCARLEGLGYGCTVAGNAP
ncbi:MAG: hypothetical protein Q8P41_13850 [Pseudomonadota bacterium]|nr:hypothetical protein [Pseudomonadota bacterium]